MRFEAWCVPALDTAAARISPVDPAPVRGRPGEEVPVDLRRLEVTAEDAARLVDALGEGRDAGLLGCPAADLARALGRVGARFLEPGDPLRSQALALLPGTAGVSPAMAEAVLDGMAPDWTEARLLELLEHEVGGPAALDGFVPAPGGRRVRALGFRLQVHLTAGTVPGVSVTSLIRGLLVKGAVLLKPGRADAVLPVLFLRGLAEAEPDLARAAAVVYWTGGASEMEDVALRAADLVVVYGGDETVTSVRRRLPATTPLVAYHHRISFGVVGRDALGGDALVSNARAVARAVAMFDQRGCVSPHAIFVEAGGEGGPSDFAAALADALAALDRSLPPGFVDDDEAAAVQQVRGTAELRRAAGEALEVWSGGSSPWTVVLQPGEEFEASCLNRVVRVVPVTDAGAVPGRIARLRTHLQTVALAGLGPRREALAEALARAGALRVTTFRDQPFPPPWWHHDGEGPLTSLLRWTDLEV